MHFIILSLLGNYFKKQYERGMDRPHRKFLATALVTTYIIML